MISENRRYKGTKKEEQAAEYLSTQGYEILERNFYTRNGEIDIVAKENGYLVFVEVRSKKASSVILPQETIDRQKAFHLINASKVYLLSHGFGENTPVRYDFVGIHGSNITLLKNVLEAF